MENKYSKYSNAELVIPNLLEYAKKFDTACILLSNNFPDKNGKYTLIAGFGAERTFSSPAEMEGNTGLKLGFVSYDLKNNFEKLTSTHPAAVSVPDFYFFTPKALLEIDRNGEILNDTLDLELSDNHTLDLDYALDLDWKCRTAETEYYRNIDAIRDQIKEGDFYEINYCIEWEASRFHKFDPYSAFYKLNKTAPAPFAAFFKLGDRYLLCSSPERFLQKQGSRLISQPIKGTRKRLKNAEEDKLIAEDLLHSEKDRSENIMITDLVRNDLSRICKNGTVKVEELCKIYSYSHVHQMVSLVSGELLRENKFNDILEATFPMGSMTGAPKIRVMQEIEKYENFRRGWYSGSVGWHKNGDFDLNVVIRSLQFDEETNALVYNVGGAIVYDSVAEKEYEECAVKAAGILSALKPAKK